jgi:hypothetical protein
MSRAGRPRNHGQVYRRPNTAVLWVRYPDRGGRITRESAGTADWNEAEQFLRDRLDARDDGKLAAVLSSKNGTFNDWADWFLEKRSKPTFRAEKTQSTLPDDSVHRSVGRLFLGASLKMMSAEASDCRSVGVRKP